MDLGLTGKNVIVTGGSKGIGREICRAFLAEGAHVAFCARNAEQIQATAKNLSPMWSAPVGRCGLPSPTRY